jgi:hypothetical protein
MKKRIIISSALFAVILSAALFVAFGLPKETEAVPERLSAEKTAELRAQIPLSSEMPLMVSMVVPPLDHVINELDNTFVRAKVIEPIPVYALSLSEGAYSGRHRFFGYKMETVSDTLGKLDKGEIITLIANLEMKEMFPDLKAGDEIVASSGFSKTQAHGDNFGFLPFGMFYITEGGYCFSTYDMEDAVALDGIHVDELMSKQLRKR